MRKKHEEPQLCPTCPKLPFLHLVKPESYTRTPALTSNVKLCAKLRALNMGRPCPHYPKGERIDRYFKAVDKLLRMFRPRKKRRRR